MDYEDTITTFYHVVYFWVKDGTPSEKVDQLVADCKAYLGSIQDIRELYVGTPAGTQRDVVDNSFDVSIIARFENKEAHDRYQEDETHKQFIERNKDIWERVQVYDMIKK